VPAEKPAGNRRMLIIGIVAVAVVLVCCLCACIIIAAVSIMANSGSL
jgi:hypothetical protein